MMAGLNHDLNNNFIPDIVTGLSKIHAKPMVPKDPCTPSQLVTLVAFANLTVLSEVLSLTIMLLSVTAFL